MPSDDLDLDLDLVQVQEPPPPSDEVSAKSSPRPGRIPEPQSTRPGHPADKPVRVAWREGALTRAEELASLHAWVASSPESKRSEVLSKAIRLHLAAPGAPPGTGGPGTGTPPPERSSSVP